MAVSLSQFHLSPLERITELFSDLQWGAVSEGSLVNWVREVAQRLEPTQEGIQRLLLESQVAYVDEMGGRIEGVLHW